MHATVQWSLTYMCERSLGVEWVVGCEQPLWEAGGW